MGIAPINYEPNTPIQQPKANGDRKGERDNRQPPQAEQPALLRHTPALQAVYRHTHAYRHILPIVGRGRGAHYRWGTAGCRWVQGAYSNNSSYP